MKNLKSLLDCIIPGTERKRKEPFGAPSGGELPCCPSIEQSFCGPVRLKLSRPSQAT